MPAIVVLCGLAGDLASRGGACGAGFIILDRIDWIFRMLASRQGAKALRKAGKPGGGNSSVNDDEDIRPVK
ncbi:MAG: hypothetical protein R6U13_03675 [Desulfatiglandaceae bacterium]